MIRGISFPFRFVILATLLTFGLTMHAQTSPEAPDIPAKYEAPTASYDYVRREVMIPMRDGVKLYTVIVIPKGAKTRANPADAHAL